jgi:hypothetical protein
MRTLLLVSMVLTIVLGVASAENTLTRAAASQSSPGAGATRKESPFACDRLALTAAQRKRHFDELPPLLRKLKKKGARELADGYEFEFPADPASVLLVAEWAAGERLCCPFFNIELRMEPEGGPLFLRLTGRPGTKDFIRVDGAGFIQAGHE